MLAIAVIDARWFIIPNELSAAGFALGAGQRRGAARRMPSWEAVGIALLRGAVLALLFLGLRALLPAPARARRHRARRREARGRRGRMARLARRMPIAIEIAALAAIAVFGVRHYAGGAPFDPALKFPFGLFLAPSIWLGWLHRGDVAVAAI